MRGGAGGSEKGRPPKTYSQAERIINMLRALASRSMTIKDLSDEFGICRRQVYRDIGRIQEEGHPLEQSDRDGEKTWQLPLTYKGLPPITNEPRRLDFYEPLMSPRSVEKA